MAGMGQQPLRHVADAGVDAGGRRQPVVGGFGCQGDPAVAAAHVRPRPARAGLDPGQAHGGVIHAQRLEQPALHFLFVELPGGGKHHVAHQAEGHVLVGVALARRARQRRAAELVRDLVVLGVAFDVAVEGVVRLQADAVAEQVGHGHLAGPGRVGQLEAGHVVHDLAVPAQAAVVDQQAGHGAGEGLGQRGQAEHGVRVDRLRADHVGDAIAACAEDAPVLHDRHRQAGNALALDQLLGQRLETGDVEPRCQRLGAGAGIGAVRQRLRRWQFARCQRGRPGRRGQGHGRQ